VLANRVWNIEGTTDKSVLRLPDWWDQLDLETPPDEFVRLISTYIGTDVVMKSSPGFPYCLEDVGFASNEAFIRHWGITKVANDVWQRIRKLSTMSDDIPTIVKVNPLRQRMETTPQFLTFNDYCDPIRVFVKNELHSEAKAKVGRWRLIMSISLIDQLVERVLHGPLNQWEIRNYAKLPFMPGMGHGITENYEAVFDRVFACAQPTSAPGWREEDAYPLVQVLGNDLIQSDVSHFDWCVSDQFLYLDVLYRVGMVEKANPDRIDVLLNWHRVAIARARCLALSELVLRDGTSISQTHAGMQKSGSYNTSSTNSHIRVMLRMVAIGALNVEYNCDAPIQPLHMVAMGDDAVEAFPLVSPGYDSMDSESEIDDDEMLGALSQHYSAFGFHMKQLQIVQYVRYINPFNRLTWRLPSFEFCGHIYSVEPQFVSPGETKWVYKWYPTRPEKLLLNLLVKRPNSKQDYHDRLSGLKAKFVHMPSKWTRYEKLIQAVGWVEPEK